MQLIKLPKSIDIADTVLPELVTNWMNGKNVQNVINSFVQKLGVNMLISWVITQSKGGKPHRHTFGIFTHLALAIWDLNNHDLFWIILDPGSQKWVSLSLKSTSTVPFQAATSYDNIRVSGQHSSNSGLPCLMCLFHPCSGRQDQPNENLQRLFMCAADIGSNITNGELPWTSMIIAQNIFQVSRDGFKTDYYNDPSARNIIFRNPPPITCAHLAIYNAILWVSEICRFKVMVYLKWEMYQNNLNIFEIIPVV